MNFSLQRFLSSIVLRCLLSAFLLLLFFSAQSHAEEMKAGRIVNLKGGVEFQKSGGTWEMLRIGQFLEPGDAIRTGPEGWAALLLADETLLQLHRDTILVLKEVAPKAGWLKKPGIVPASASNVRSLYRLERGQIWIRNKDRKAIIDIETPTVTAGFRGTEFNLRVTEDGTVYLTVLEGLVAAWNEWGSIQVASREQAIFRPGDAPQKRILLTPEDAVQWTLTVPPILTSRDIPPLSNDRDPLKMERSELEGLVQAVLLHLSRREIGEARTILHQAVKQNPRESLLWSLLALTSLVIGQKAEALEAAKRGVQLAPLSPTALMIEAYAHQAFFDLDRALQANRKALAIQPTHVPGLLNLSRLLFGMDDLDGAWKAMEEASRLGSEDGEVQNVKGFLLLARRKEGEAIPVFRKACTLNPDIGEPHLGLALAYMRKGRVPEAMEEMTTAVLLDPRRSLFLSYWGKMLYQLERFKEALDMLGLASDLDPRDPTPHLYRAFIFRDLNRPTEAIDSLNRAIALNDHRAVYRSRFLLDQDLAVKNVNLALVYNQLGLSDWAKSKATASVKQDYLNSAAHKFLGRALSDLEGHDGPADSETLLARILQPANLNAFNTFNDYTSFFERPSIGGALRGYLGNHDTYGGLFRTFGAVPQINTAFFGSTLYDHTDGWRRTNSERHRSILGLIKWDPTPEDGIALTARNTYLRQDDYNTAWEWDQPSDPIDSAWKRETQLEVGYHRRLSTHSDLLLYGTYQDVHGKWIDHTIDLNYPPDIWEQFFTDRFRLPYYQVQGQYHLKWRDHQVMLGTLHYIGREGAKVTDVWFKNGVVDPTFSSLWQNRYANRFSSFYLHDIWRVFPAVTLHAAAYYDHMILSDAISGSKWSLSEFSPRLGLIVSPFPHDTFRLAAFQFLVPFNSYRIDPADVAGVTLSHNPRWGSVVREADLVWEHEWSKGFLSINPFYLKSKYSYESTGESTRGAKSEIRGRVKGIETAVNQLVWPGVGIAVWYGYRDVKNEGDPRADRKDHRVTAGLTYVHPSGLSASLRQTFRHIDSKSEDRPDETIWLTDMKIAYEFPKKRGSISLEMKNIFNAHFNWVTDTFIYNGRSPAREIVSTLSLNF